MSSAGAVALLGGAAVALSLTLVACTTATESSFEGLRRVVDPPETYGQPVHAR